VDVIDRRVATEVMGWRVEKGTYWTQSAEGGNTWRVIPPFSTNIAAAWLVVERMRELGWAFALYDPAFDVDQAKELVRCDWKKGHESWMFMADSAPAAICAAALAAVKGETGE
jgi:hypothetical protein